MDKIEEIRAKIGECGLIYISQRVRIHRIIHRIGDRSNQ